MKWRGLLTRKMNDTQEIASIIIIFSVLLFLAARFK